MTSIHWFFTALRLVVSSFLLSSRLLMPTTVLPSSVTVALTWTQRFTIASSSDSSLHAGRSSRLRGLSPPPHRGRINNREQFLKLCLRRRFPPNAWRRFLFPTAGPILLGTLSAADWAAPAI